MSAPSGQYRPAPCCWPTAGRRRRQRQEVLLAVAVGVGLECGAEVCGRSSSSTTCGQILNIASIEPVGHLAVVGGNDVGGDVVRSLLDFCAVKHEYHHPYLELDGHAMFLLKGLDDLIDEELLLPGRAEQARSKDQGLCTTSTSTSTELQPPSTSLITSTGTQLP